MSDCMSNNGAERRPSARRQETAFGQELTYWETKGADWQMAQITYWQKKLRIEGRPEKLADQMILFDQVVGQWHHMESKRNLVELLGHMGKYHGVCKVLSYDGTPDGKDGSDPGNWYYAVCIRHMLTLFPSRDWRVLGTEQLNDESAGDIMEAIWGLLWHRQTKGPLKDAIPVSVITTETLHGYCQVMTSVVEFFLKLQPEYLVGSEWPTSKKLAIDLM